MITLKGKIKDYILTAKNDILITFCINSNNYNQEDINTLLIKQNDNKNNKQVDFKIQVSEWKDTRSLNANAYFHLLVHKIAEKLKIGNDECKIKMNLEYGTPATDKNGKNVIVKLPSSVNVSDFYEYSKFIAEKEEKGLKLSYYLFYKQTHTLDTKEMARLIDGVVSEAEQLGIETLTPEQLLNLKSLWSSME